MVGAVTGRAMAVAVPAIVARQQPVERGQQVVVRAGADLDDDEAGRGVRHEDRQQPVLGVDVGEERGALGGEIRQAAARAGPDGQLAGVYGKMLRSASRRRPRPPRRRRPTRSASARRAPQAGGAPLEQPDGRAVARVEERVDEAADARRRGHPDRHLEDLAAELGGARTAAPRHRSG